MELLTLPVEVRQIVYDFTLGNVRLADYYMIRGRTIRRYCRKLPKVREDRLGVFTVSAHGRWPVLLAVNHKIRKETFDLIFARATFKIACHHPNIVITKRIRLDIELAHCGLIDSYCKEDIFSFSNLRRLTCQVYFNDYILEDYGYEPGNGPDTKADLQKMILYGLGPANEWTMVNAGYPYVMKIFLDKNRAFKMRIMATASWGVPKPLLFQVSDTPTSRFTANGL